VNRSPAIHLRGLGLLSSYGAGVSAAVAGMRAGRAGITPLTLFDVPFRDSLQVSQFDHAPFPSGEAGAMVIIETVVREALAEAGLTLDDLRDAALVIGTSGFLFAAEAEYRLHASPDTKAGLPLRAPGYLTQQLAVRLGIGGPVMTLSTACSSSANALLVAADFLRRGEATRALVIGVEGLSAITLNGFHSLMLLDPEGCRPFDARRRGMQLGEAVAAVILEANDTHGDCLLGGRSRRPASRDTGASLLGGANLCDIHHVTSASPDGSAMRAVMEMALADVQLAPEDIALIKAHGTGSPDNDAAEAAAMRSLWGDVLPPFTAIKRYLGHTLGACGVVELAALLGCLRAGFVPPTAGFEQADPELHLAPLTTALTTPRGPVMFNFFGFGGNYASFVIHHG
jgi:3-oxoacyl-(acyl-carrier-protein) synthase